MAHTFNTKPEELSKMHINIYVRFQKLIALRQVFLSARSQDDTVFFFTLKKRWVDETQKYTQYTSLMQVGKLI